MKLGFIGLGKMGNRMVSKLLEEGHEVVVWNRTKEKIIDFRSQILDKDQLAKLFVAESVNDLVGKLDKPRIVWSMLPAGEATEKILKQVQDDVEAGDIAVDGGNSRFSDTDKRHESFKKKGVRFLGIGVSGGLIARESGYPMMVGGDKSAYHEIKPILESLAKPSGGYEYFGEGGAGHYVKMVHNAIEYGYMQSIGEGFGVLEKSPYNLDLLAVANLYDKGSLVSGFMMERAIEVLGQDPNLSKIEGVIGKASGETVWAVEEAKKKGLPIEIIERSLEIRRESETSEKIRKSFAARMVAALRNAFGGHEVKKILKK
ncbi:MAG: NADP-dependent phosphogluconate dehydrogenase [Patescibacteria group bacterium]|mgnify:CR=1 FL=1